MDGIYKIEEMLCDELNSLGKKGELTAGNLETIDRLTHALKNTQKVICHYEDMGKYSNASGSYRRGGRGRGANQYGSYAGGGNRGGSYVYPRYDGYSRAEGAEGMVSELRELMKDAPNKQIRHKMEELISEVEMM